MSATANPILQYLEQPMTYENAVHRLVREHAAKMAARDQAVAPASQAHAEGQIPVGEATEVSLATWFAEITPPWQVQA